MRLAVMQPYFFPYVGYFELMASVDIFVFLEDVQYCRRGWVNRNVIKCGAEGKQYLTLPILKCPQRTKICDVVCDPGWRPAISNKLQKTYGAKLHPEILQALECPSAMLSVVLKGSLKRVAELIGVGCSFESSLNITDKSGTARIIDICRHFGATDYFNLPGGSSLYSQEYFKDIRLRILDTTSYHNRLSIIDCLCEEFGQARLNSWLHSFRRKQDERLFPSCR